jgi:2-polyprenyl-6-methoxyphenol hydroxylase-like FAD-dependent oxidoreductase
MKVLISGAGIAGPTLAYWLAHHGFEPALLESAPALRTGGYVIDFWGAGFDIADRMGLLPEIRRKGYMVREVVAVNERGKRVSGFSVEVFSRITEGRYISLPRGDLAAAIFAKIDGRVETMFGDSVRSIEQTEAAVRVSFQSGTARDFDLVVGADGLHSRVRELVFGPESHFEKYLGYKVAAFEVPGYRPRDELTYVMYTEVGGQVSRFTMRGDRTMFLFIFADEDGAVPADLKAQKARLRDRFGKSGWECPRILDALDSASDLYFDRVSQIRMNRPDHIDPHQEPWTRGRVTLAGDAAFCVSLLAGQGSALAMVAAYILAGELHRANGDYGKAFARYEDLMGPFVLAKQEAALGFAGAFAPKSKAGLFLRNQVFKLLAFDWVANIVAKRGLLDNIALPDYGQPSQ